MSFTARYSGDCVACDSPITPGQPIETVTDLDDLERPVGDDVTYRHVDCPDAETLPEVAPGEKACPSCWLIHRGECF